MAVDAQEMEAKVAALGDNASFEDIERIVRGEEVVADGAKAQADAEAAAAAEAARTTSDDGTAALAAAKTDATATAAAAASETQVPGATLTPEQQAEANGAPITSRDGRTTIPHGVLAGARKQLATVKQERDAERTRATALEQENETLRQQLQSRPATQQDVKDVQAQANAAGVVDAAGKPVNVLTIDVAKLRESYDGPIADVVEQLQNAVNSQAGVISKQAGDLERLRGTETARARTDAEVKADAAQAEIDAVPALADWQANDPAKWAAALAMDAALMNQDAWKGKPSAERFRHVAKSLGGDMTPQAKPSQQQQAPAAGKNAVDIAIANARPAVPASHSDLPAGSHAAQSETELLEGMSVEALGALPADRLAGYLDRIR